MPEPRLTHRRQEKRPGNLARILRIALALSSRNGINLRLNPKFHATHLDSSVFDNAISRTLYGIIAASHKKPATFPGRFPKVPFQTPQNLIDHPYSVRTQQWRV